MSLELRYELVLRAQDYGISMVAFLWFLPPPAHFTLAGEDV